MIAPATLVHRNSLSPSGAGAGIEMWGGIECTVNRVGDRFFDQVRRTGHDWRIDDLDAFAELGLTTLRYPILWERCVANAAGAIDWRWVDERLGRMQELGMDPIASLLHHGSGPAFTNLLDPEFPEHVARFAGRVAQRYPWIDRYIPVNEPGTTARFSALYGHWYPHHTSDQSFATALINQCRATVLAMRAIRVHNPLARLIQTEDIGKTWSTPELDYQARFQNERRWLTFDLLCGQLEPGMIMWDWLRHVGISAAELNWFRSNTCPPDLIGIDYYPTSDRYLDHRSERYPGEPVGGNGRDQYVDVSAVGVREAPVPSVLSAITDASARYGIPIAITEAHLGSSGDEQLRWLRDVWSDCLLARQVGIDIRAVTAWALLGMFDWHCLLTRDDGVYEPGVFTIANGVREETDLAGMVRSLATADTHDHPALDHAGWWTRPERFLT